MVRRRVAMGMSEEGRQAHSHNGVKSVLSAHYNNEGKIDKYLIKTYGKLFNMRPRGDYEDWAILEEDDINPLIEPAKRFIAEIERLMSVGLVS